MIPPKNVLSTKIMWSLSLVDEVVSHFFKERNLFEYWMFIMFIMNLVNQLKMPVSVLVPLPVRMTLPFKLQ